MITALLTGTPRFTTVMVNEEIIWNEAAPVTTRPPVTKPFCITRSQSVPTNSEPFNRKFATALGPIQFHSTFEATVNSASPIEPEIVPESFTYTKSAIIDELAPTN